MRLFSTKSFKPLGALVHHKAGIQALAFAHHVHILPKPTPTNTPTQHRNRHHHGRHRHHHYPHLGLQPEEEDQRHPCATDGVGEAAACCSSSAEEDTTDIGGGDEAEEDDEMTMAEKTRCTRWLVSGGKDGRVVVWELMDFNGTRSGSGVK